MAAIVQKREVDGWLEHFQSMKAARVDYERKWQMASDYILPRRDFSVTQRPGQLRPHRVTSSVATNAANRMAAFLLAYWFDPTRPFLLPNVKRGLAIAGRRTGIDNAGMDYLDWLKFEVFDFLMRPKANLMLRAGSMLKEFCVFGDGVIWTGRKRGFGPYFVGRPIHACWWSENEEGDVDTLYFLMKLPVHRVIARWPATAPQHFQGTSDKDAPLNEQTLTDVLLACRPRPGGRYGAVCEAKPFAFLAILVEKGAILEESGYDTFPYSVFRDNPLPGEAYAEGAGCQALPDVMVLNHLQEALENIASQKAAPAIAVPARMFGKTLDRRPSAMNSYNPVGLGLQRADQAILKLDFTGDPTEALAMVKMLTDNIETIFFTDWMRLRESGDMTAEEVNERRDLRLRGCSSIVANLEKPTTTLGDRAMEVMIAEGLIPPGPASVAGATVDWEYAGPLAIAQLRGNVQAMLQLINAAGLVKGFDPAAAEVIDMEESLRIIAESLGAPPAATKSRTEVQAKREADAHAQEQAQNAAKLALVAKAANDGSQAVSNVAQLGAPGTPGAPGGGAPPVGPPPGGAPFAPASPFTLPQAAA